MSRFENSYLAESVGYNNGHARGMSSGIDVGLEHGYTKGWNDATTHANGVVAELEQEIDRLSNEIHKGNAHIKDLRASLEKSHHVSEPYHVERDELGAENAQLKQQLQLQQEQAQALRAEYETMFKSFLGVVAIARPAMKAVAKLPFKERGQIYYEYGDEAARLQTLDYVKANRFPANQQLILKYLPIANQVFNQTYKQLQQQEGDSKNITQNASES